VDPFLSGYGVVWPWVVFDVLGVFVFVVFPRWGFLVGAKDCEPVFFL
jgi:hypothetical protein